MTSSPLIKPERQGMSFAVHGWTPPKNPIQASDFAVREWTGFAVHWWTAAAEARKINEVNSRAQRG